jgi:aminopeptidase
MTMTSHTSHFDDQQRRYAELLVKVGLNLQPNQCLIITSEIVHRDFVQLAVAEAYRAGAKYVHVDWGDPLSAKARLLHSADDNLDYVPEWVIGQFREYTNDHWARLSLTGEEFPGIFDDADPARMRRAGVARARQLRFYSEAMMSMQMQWCVAALPTPNWARKVFPDLPDDEAVSKLWSLILQTVRLNQPDPVAAWREHDRRLQRIVNFMAERQVRALRFLDSTPAEDGKPASDLTIGLTDAPVWVAAGNDTAVGARCFPNMPTEEVFTTPHRLRVNGYVRTSKPGFPLQREVDGAYFRFENGELAEFGAQKGEDTLAQFFQINGARHLGEVALVDVRSPINQAGVLFYNTLFDENAVCHFAFGKAYAEGMAGADALSPEQRVEAGVNESDTHCDLMIGTPTMDVIGHCADGSQVTIMERGEFVAEVVG